MIALPTVGLLGLVGLTSMGPSGVDTVTATDVRRPQQDFEWRGRIERGMAIEIKGVLGDVRAQAASGNEVEVTARVREGRRGYREDVTFDVVEHADGVTICAVYPTPRRARRENECAPGDRGQMSTDDIDVSVYFTVLVPAGVDFIGRTVNGEVVVEPIDGNAEAHTVNGDVEVTAAGRVQASTVNGSIWADMGQADWSGALEFETVNGSITVELPESAGAEVTAQTVNGGIDSDFPITIRGRFSGRRMSGTIGDGGGRLWLETVNGAVRLRRK